MEYTLKIIQSKSVLYLIKYSAKYDCFNYTFI